MPVGTPQDPETGLTVVGEVYPDHVVVTPGALQAWGIKGIDGPIKIDFGDRYPADYLRAVTYHMLFAVMLAELEGNEDESPLPPHVESPNVA